MCYRYERAPQRGNAKHFRDGLCVVACGCPVKGRVYYYDKPNIGSCLFFSFDIFLPIGEGVPAAFRGRGLQAEVKGGVLSTSFVVYCKNMDKV